MKCLIEMLDRMLDEMPSHPFKMHKYGLKITEISLTYIPKKNEIKQREWMKEKGIRSQLCFSSCPYSPS
jgi:hypothetical protein